MIAKNLKSFKCNSNGGVAPATNGENVRSYRRLQAGHRDVLML